MNTREEDAAFKKSIIRWSTVGTVVSMLLIAGGMYGCPQYNVYQQRMAGIAILAHAQSERLAQVQDAEGKLEAAAKLAQVDIARAEGVAKANAIIGESLKNNEAYLRWLFVESLKESKNQIIYVPTETQLPILEASRTQQK